MTTADREITITRLFDAPRELVWQAMTDPRHLVQWWGPNGFTTTVHTMELWTGGAWNLTMHGPDGTNYPNHSIFQEIVYPARIVFSHGGGKPGGPEADFIGTWTFSTVRDQTQVVIHMLFPTAVARDAVVQTYGAIEGGKQTLERLATHLPRMGLDARHLIIERLIDAPPALVFQCWTDPAHLARWWGPAGFTNPVCKADPRVGGAWRIVMCAPDGTEYPCQGVYLEIVPNKRLVLTNIATDAAGKPVLDGLTTVTFADADGKTRMTVDTRATALIPDAIRYLQGMNEGWTQTLDRLDARVAASGISLSRT
jgi:uncharacterized protein YndB with AHSA1/START domain